MLDTGLPSISFSIDGSDPEIHDKYRGIKGLHAQLTKVIRRIKREKPEMAVTVVSIVMNDTISQLVNYVNWAQDLGVDRVLFQPISPNYGVIDSDRQWYKKSSYGYAPGGRQSLEYVKNIQLYYAALVFTTREQGMTKVSLPSPSIEWNTSDHAF